VKRKKRNCEEKAEEKGKSSLSFFLFFKAPGEEKAIKLKT